MAKVTGWSEASLMQMPEARLESYLDILSTIFGKGKGKGKDKEEGGRRRIISRRYASPYRKKAERSRT